MKISTAYVAILSAVALIGVTLVDGDAQAREFKQLALAVINYGDYIEEEPDDFASSDGGRSVEVYDGEERFDFEAEMDALIWDLLDAGMYDEAEELMEMMLLED